MKKVLLLILSAVICVSAFATAEEAASVFECEYFTVVLPDGITVPEDSVSYTAAAAEDYGDNIETVLVASDLAQIRLVTVNLITSDETADLAASNASEILLGSNDTVVSETCGKNLCSVFSCSIESVNYDFYYLSDGKHVYCLTCTGLTPEEAQNIAASISFK